MSHADRPYITRSLAGVDQALGEGRARPPVELLDQLRERLDRLDPNHPSASEPAGDLDRAQAQEVQASRPDRSSLRKESADASCDEQPGDQGASEPPSAGEPGQPSPAAADGAVNGSAADGEYRVVEAGRVAAGGPHRPWFADDPGAPWFVEPWFVE